MADAVYFNFLFYFFHFTSAISIVHPVCRSSDVRAPSQLSISLFFLGSLARFILIFQFLDLLFILLPTFPPYMQYGSIILIVFIPMRYQSAELSFICLKIRSLALSIYARHTATHCANAFLSKSYHILSRTSTGHRSLIRLPSFGEWLWTSICHASGPMSTHHCVSSLHLSVYERLFLPMLHLS
jgi:hypothetical protein